MVYPQFKFSILITLYSINNWAETAPMNIGWLGCFNTKFGIDFFNVYYKNMFSVHQNHRGFFFKKKRNKISHFWVTIFLQRNTVFKRITNGLRLLVTPGIKPINISPKKSKIGYSYINFNIPLNNFLGKRVLRFFKRVFDLIICPEKFLKHDSLI